MSTPQSTIYICSNVPLNNRYDHTLYFGHYSVRDSYFANKVVKTLTAYTYLRKHWKLKVEATMSESKAWSYLYFRNGANNSALYANVYYYFINSIEYINDNTVELSLELDVMTTYSCHWILRRCYVEREHSRTDVPGENTLDEGLDVGDLINDRRETTNISNDLAIMIAATVDINHYNAPTGSDEGANIVAGYYDKIFGGFQITATPIEDEVMGNMIRVLGETLYSMSVAGKADAIFAMWQYPKQLLSYDDGRYEKAVAKYVTGVKSLTHTTWDAPTTLDGYTPKNKKLLQYPYCFMYATNNKGGAAVYPYEKFDNTTRQFHIQGNIAPDAEVKLVPMHYKGISFNFDESLSLGCYPQCAWNSDTYKMWLAQNQNQQDLGMGMSALKIIGGAASVVGGIAATTATGGAGAGVGAGAVAAGIGMISSGATSIASQLAQKADKEIQPPQARGTFSGSHNLSRGIHEFHIYHKTIDAYHAEVIDNYFSMYGYATRKVKVPNINARPAWCYVKTIGSNVGGNIPHEDLMQINAIFDKGITFWKNTDVGNYSLANEV